jgi:hypothetical protein
MGYETAKIYQLICDDGHYYYGSTINELRIRFRDHKNASKRQPYRVYEHINAAGWEDVRIVLVEEYPCANRQELNKKENEYILAHKADPLCLNNNLACLTDAQRKEYKRKHTEENKEKLAEYHRAARTGNQSVAEYQRRYRTDNKEELRESKRKYYADHKEERDRKNREQYYANREAILQRKREKYHSNQSAQT